MKEREMATGIQDRVKAMYEAHPFPRLDDPQDAEWRAREQRYFDYLGVTRGHFEGAVVLDAGCGTGEKALHISTLGPKKVIGIDLSSASVEHARKNADRFGATNLTFQTGSVLELPFADETFDIVQSMGVLHHTSDAYRGFTELVRVLKPGGIVMLGLYNRYADWLYHLERALVASLAGDDVERRLKVSKKLFGFRERWLAERDNMDLDTRLYDKYAHPQSTAHAIGEVLGWFEKNAVEFRGIYPPVKLKDMLKIVSRRNSKGDFQVPPVLRPAAMLSEALSDIFPAHENRGPVPYPSFAMRFLVQSGLFVAGMQDYSYGVIYSATKPTRS
jgi:SAM-dependent methyltransferase